MARTARSFYGNAPAQCVPGRDRSRSVSVAEVCRVGLTKAGSSPAVLTMIRGSVPSEPVTYQLGNESDHDTLQRPI